MTAPTCGRSVQLVTEKRVGEIIQKVCANIAEQMPLDVHIQVAITWTHNNSTKYASGGVGNGLAREMMLEKMREDLQDFNRDLRENAVFEAEFYDDDEDDDEPTYL